MTEVAPGICRLKLPIDDIDDVTLAYVNAYLIKRGSDLILVDTGWNTDKAFAALQRELAEAGASPEDVTLMVVTHTHPDHYGLAGRLRKLHGTRLAFHELEKEFIDATYVHWDELLDKTDRWLAANGMSPEERQEIREASESMDDFVVPVYPDLALRGGETISAGDLSFRVIWAPGHANGLICLYEPKLKVLIAGDHILPTITPNVGSHPQATANPLGNYLQSLREIGKLEIDLVLPGHEEPFGGVRARIAELIGHHEERNREILAALQDKTLTPRQIAASISWGANPGWHDLPCFHKRLALSEALAHLELMESEGRLEKIPGDGIIYYRQN